MKLLDSCKHPWHKQKDIICLDTSGMLPTGVTKKNFFLNSQRIGTEKEVWLD